MAATRTKLTGDWQLVNTSGTNFTLQANQGDAEITFATSAPASTVIGFKLVQGQGLTQEYGTGNCYARGHGFVTVMT